MANLIEGSWLRRWPLEAEAVAVFAAAFLMGLAIMKAVPGRSWQWIPLLLLAIFCVQLCAFALCDMWLSGIAPLIWLAFPLWLVDLIHMNLASERELIDLVVEKLTRLDASKRKACAGSFRVGTSTGSNFLLRAEFVGR